jgi:hypothetical protein
MHGRFRVAFLGLGTLLLGEAALYLASSAQTSLDFDVGPSTGSYLPGFTESEERLPVTCRRGRRFSSATRASSWGTPPFDSF